MVDSSNPIIDDLNKDLNKNKQDIQDQIDENLSHQNPDKPDVDKPAPETPTPETDDKPDPKPEKPAPEKVDKPKEDEDKTPPQNIPDVNDGISRAYADEMPPQKRSEKGKSKSHDSKPPERGKPPKVAGGKDIMEVAWNEFWAFCDSVIDGTVDLAFDFITFVLYPTSNSSNDEVKKELDVMDIGAKHQKESIEKIQKTYKFTTDVCAEIDKNLQNVIAGENAEWTLIKTEPAFFARLVEAKKKAIKEPSSPEAEMIKRWENMPQVLEKMSENYKRMVTLANHLATAEEYLNPSVQNKDAEIKAAKEKYKDNPKKLKETLEAIEESYKNPEKKTKESIAARSQKHLEELSQNVNKIRVIYKDNPEKLREELGKYMEGISTALKTVRSEVYVNMYEKQDTGSKAKKQAQASIDAMASAISDFMVEDKPVKDYKPAEKHEIVKIDMDEKYSKLDILRLIKSNVMAK